MSILEEIKWIICSKCFFCGGSVFAYDSTIFIKNVSTATIQRLGYLLDCVLSKENLAASLYEKIKQMKLEFYRLPLKASGKIKGFSSDEKWKVIVNTDIEIDE